MSLLDEVLRAHRTSFTTASVVATSVFGGSTPSGRAWVETENRRFLVDWKKREPFAAETTYTLTLDAQGLAHCATGPAISKESVREFYWHGVLVPEYVVLKPETITAQQIDAQENAEVRRVMLNRFGGLQKYMQECGAKLIATDEVGELYRRKKLKGEWEDFCFVKVENSTPEPDGSIKDYWLRVPPTSKTAKEGIAWTFQLTGKDYAPVVQT